MWQLKDEKDGLRTYTNSATGSKCETKKVYTDKEGNSWYMFQDLMMMPYTRQFAATKISSLYALGLSKDDLFGFINTGKTLCKANDPEKYEKLYAQFLDFETKANNATDAIKQMSSLACVYFLLNGENIDSFDGALQGKKMAILEADSECHAFFLQLQISAIERYQQHLNLLSTIVSPNRNELSEAITQKSKEPQMQSET